MLGGLGAGRTTTNLTAAIVGAEVDDDGDGDVLGPPASYSSVERTRGPRRFFWTAQGRDATAVGAVVVSGVDGSARLRARKRVRGGGESRE